MIKGISQTGPYIDVQGGNPGSIYVNLSSVNPGTGTVRFNGQDMEVFDGNIWQKIMNNYASVGLNQQAIEILNWARDKMQEESKLEKLARENPTIADAVIKYKEAEEQLKVVLTLTNKE